jgi:nucleoside-diphosphate-sugar epimerase
LNIFVAGATGAVGRRLVPLLVAADHSVTGVARSDAKALSLRLQGAKPITLDLFDGSAVAAAVKGHDVVINMATHIPTGVKAMLPGAFNENNRIRREASTNLANAASAAGASRFIQESFAPVYPDRGDEWIDETVPIEPARYVESVRDAESAANDFSKRGGTGVVLRFSFFYDPGNAFTLDIIRLVRAGVAPVFGSPEGFMSSLWTDDAATSVVSALDVQGGTYNVTDDQPVRRREAFDALAAALGAKRPKPLPQLVTRLSGSVGETLGRSLRLSNARFRSVSGWKPQVRSVLEGWPLVVSGLEKV